MYCKGYCQESVCKLLRLLLNCGQSWILWTGSFGYGSQQTICHQCIFNRFHALATVTTSNLSTKNYFLTWKLSVPGILTSQGKLLRKHKRYPVEDSLKTSFLLHCAIRATHSICLAQIFPWSHLLSHLWDLVCPSKCKQMALLLFWCCCKLISLSFLADDFFFNLSPFETIFYGWRRLITIPLGLECQSLLYHKDIHRKYELFFPYERQKFGEKEYGDCTYHSHHWMGWVTCKQVWDMCTS